MQNLYESIISTHDITSLVPKKKCPFHHDTHSSFSVFEYNGKQMWKCHACDICGDVIDLMGYMRIPGYDKKVDKQRAAELLNNNIAPIFSPAKPKEKHSNILPSWLWKDYIPMADNVRRYCNIRGISDQQIDEYHLGSMSSWNPLIKDEVDSFLTIPTFMLNTLVNMKFRNVGDGNRYLSYHGSRISVFNYDKVAGKSETVILCKGEIAAMVVGNYTGILTCAPTCGENSDPTELSNALAFANVIVIGDNDSIGRQAGERRAKLTHGKLHFPPQQFKDVDQWLLMENETAVKEIRSWTQQM